MLIGICLVCLPLKHLKINSDYGYRIHPLSGKYSLHAGIDFKARNDTVYAVLAGRVKAAGNDEGLGLRLRLVHGELESVYGHLSRMFVFPGDTVRTGEPIGLTGATGRVTGEHLHFSIIYRHKYINPLKFLYELLKKQENEQNFQSTTRAAFR